MNIQLLKSDLLIALSLAEKISGKNLTLPVLNCLLLTAEKNKLSIKSTNLDLGIDIQVLGTITEEGVVAVSGSVLFGVVSNTNSKKINLKVKNGNLIVKTNENTSLVKTQPHEDFPTLPTIEEATSFTITATELLHGIKSVWYAASISTIKPELSSVFIYSDKNGLVFVSTDSFRLAEKIIHPKNPVDFEPLLIPSRNIPDIIRVLDQIGGEVEVSFNKNQISFVLNGVYLTSRLIDGSFPDYRQIIPKEFTTEIIMLKADAESALKKTNIFLDKFNQVGFSIKPKDKLVVLSSKNQDIGETEESVQTAATGDSLEINFNQKYIVDSFQSLATDSVSFSFAGIGRPMVIKGVGDISFLYLVMPMNR